MTQSNGEREAARLERAVEAFVERVGQVPDEVFHKSPTEGEWSVAEIAAHSAEIYGYWAKQIAELRGRPGEPFGRTAADPERIKFVEDHKHDSRTSLLAEIRRSAAEAAGALRAYTAEEWRTVTGLHAARGMMDMDFIANLFISGHAEEHLEQLDATVAAVTKK